MVFDAARGVSVLFGGYANGYTNETWEWNDSAWTQRLVSGPSARGVHAMAYDSARGVTVLFGGFDGTNANVFDHDTWEYNGNVWTQRTVAGPSARIGHAMAFDSLRGVTVLFGGKTSSVGVSGETWEWNGAVWTQRLVTGPAPREASAMVFDSVRGVTVLYGGIYSIGTTQTHFADTWEWDGATWTQRAVSGPPTRSAHAMVFDSARSVAVLFGGSLYVGTTSTYYQDTWEWNGTAWIRRLVGGPSPRNPSGMAFDSSRSKIVLFGGLPVGGLPVGDTWELGPGCPADFDGSGAIGVQDIFDFLSAWFAGAASADFNHVGGLTEQDIFDFLNAWFAGC